MSAEAKLTIILEGMDTASGVMKAAADKIQGDMGKVADASNRVEAAQKKTEASTKSLVLGFSGIATAAFNLFNMYDRVNDTQVQMDRTNLMVKRSTEALDQATKNYNETVAKYGEGSVEAKDASDKLSIATDALTVANERAEMAVTSHNQALTNMAIQIMPTAITMIGSLSMVMTNATAITKGFNTALEFINANPIVLVLVGITAALIYLYQNCEGVRNAVNAIGNAFITFGNAVLTLSSLIVSGWNSLVGSVAKGSDAASERFKAMDDTMYNIALHGQRAFQAVTSVIVDVTESAKKLAAAFGEVTQSSSDTTAAIDTLRKGLDDYNKQMNTNIETMKKQEENWAGSRAGLHDLRADIQNATSDQAAFNDEALKEISRLEEVATAQKTYEDALSGLSEKYNVLTATADASFARVGAAFNEAFLSGDITSAMNLADLFAARWGIDVNTVITLFEDATTVIKTATNSLQQYSDTLDGLRDQYKILVATADASFTRIGTAFNNAFLSGDMESALNLANLFAARWEIDVNKVIAMFRSIPDAIDDSLSKARESYENAFAGLTEQYNVLTATADASFTRIGAEFNKAFLSGDINSAMNLALLFSARWQISIDKVISMFEDMTTAIAKVPKTINEQLVGKAQADVETFKNCVSGKMATISSDSAEAWQTLVDDTNELIKNGLIGQAQNNIKAFVECSTSKQQKMTDDITGYLGTLTGEYDTNTKKIADLTALWEPLNYYYPEHAKSAQELADLAEIQRLTAGSVDIKAKMDQLAAWLAAINNLTNAALPTTPTLPTPAPSEGTAGPATPTGPGGGATQPGKGGKATPYAEGGIAWGPTYAMIGEREPEAVVNVRDLIRDRGVTITGPLCTGPLVVVQGSMDKAVADYAVQQLQHMLKSVVVEATSSGAPATQKRIRTGATFR
jgi:hypothetical protein